MPDAQEIKSVITDGLKIVAKMSSAASSINPIFGIVSAMATKIVNILDDSDCPVDEDFKKIQDNLGSISEKNKQCLNDIKLNEVNEAFNKAETEIKHKYEKFTDMVEKVNRDPDNAEKHMEQFKKVYGDLNENQSLIDIHKLLMNEKLFGRGLLVVYKDVYNADLEKMTELCTYVCSVFHMGYIVQMGYTVITKDDVTKEQEKWIKIMTEMEQVMNEVFLQCQ